MTAAVERGRPTFTPEQARLIRERAYAGERPTDLAAEYGVSVPLLSNLLHGHTYQTAGGPVRVSRPRRPKYRPDTIPTTTTNTTED